MSGQEAWATFGVMVLFTVWFWGPPLVELVRDLRRAWKDE